MLTICVSQVLSVDHTWRVKAIAETHHAVWDVLGITPLTIGTLDLKRSDRLAPEECNGANVCSALSLSNDGFEEK